MSISDLFTKPTIGDIMYCMIFFYQVVQTKNKMVKLKAIGNTRTTNGEVTYFVPNPESTEGAALEEINRGIFSKLLQFDSYGYFLRNWNKNSKIINWNGKPLECNGG
jgi:hypothetical protein